MKSKYISLVLLLASVPLCPSVTAAERKPPGDPGHTHEQRTAGPNRGRVMTGINPRAEFFVTPDRKVQITFLGPDGTAIAPDAQVVTVTAGDRAAPTKLSFVRQGNVLLSTNALPAGNDFPVVVEIVPSSGSTKAVEKFYFDSSQCGECKNAEYACICAH
jgi:hypothetical protein